MGIYYSKIKKLLGLKMKRIVMKPVDFVRYCRNGFRLKKENKRKDFPIRGFLPFLSDRYESAGTIDRHYFLQDIYVARKITQDKPEEHFDVGSRLDGFLAHLICNYISVTMIDIRPLSITVEGLKFRQGDATNLSGFEDGSLSSLSSLHAVEHFGLGRYGDPIGPNSCFEAMKAMQRVLKSGGKLYFSVPVSNQNGIIYNSHRVFCPKTVLKEFDQMILEEFSYIKDYKVFTLKGGEAVDKIEENSFQLGEYDLGIFIMRKK